MESVQVLVRVRPQTQNHRGRRPSVAPLTDTVLQVESPEQQTSTFDSVVGPDGTQEDVFAVAGAPMVTRCLEGYNCCVFTYGQTGSGKTFTMWGDHIDPECPEHIPEQAGLVPRIIVDLLSRINEDHVLKGDKVKWRCEFSLVEVYNETVVDLLDVEKGNLQLRETRYGNVYVENVREEVVSSVADAAYVIQEGLWNRQTAETGMNRESSRSHCILMCTVTRKEIVGEDITKETTSRLNLVDLAGSERQKTSKTSNGRLKEACGINKSLSTLGHVIKSLSEQQRGKDRHIHFRESKLTYLLQDSLGGNSKTMVIANLSSDHVNLEETISTVRFAQRAKNIKNKATINESCRGENSALYEEIEMLKSTIADLKTQIEENRKLPVDSVPTDSSLVRPTANLNSAYCEEYFKQKMVELESENKHLRDYLRRALKQGSEASQDAMLLSATLAGTQLELEAEREKGARDIHHLRNAAQKIIHVLCTKLGIAKQVVSTMSSDLTMVHSAMTRVRKLAYPFPRGPRVQYHRALNPAVEFGYNRDGHLRRFDCLFTR